jgi:hypothetical protein
MFRYVEIFVLFGFLLDRGVRFRVCRFGGWRTFGIGLGFGEEEGREGESDESRIYYTIHTSQLDTTVLSN